MTNLKQALAQAALSHLLALPDPIHLGLGTGKTINTLIPYLAGPVRDQIKTIIPSSIQTQTLLEQHGLPVIQPDQIETIDLYIDSADQFTPAKYLTKGGGGALTREKILATQSNIFWCLVEFSKFVPILGHFAIPVEILPFARRYLVSEIQKLGGRPVLRENFKTDQNNYILDIHDLDLSNPPQLEKTLKSLSGVIESGIFAQKHNLPDHIFLAHPDQKIEKIS